MTNPVLYVIMRTDLSSMNSGKAMAQAVHVGNALETHFSHSLKSRGITPQDFREFKEWKEQTTQGFGTTIVLGGAMRNIATDIEILSENFVAGVIHDPTYPLQDGDVTHLIPLDTCGYVFAPDKDEPMLRAILSKYKLHP